MNPTAKTTALLVSATLMLATAARAYETAITDTTGYTVMSASDTGTQSSIANGAHFGGSLSSTKDYLVNNALDIRTPSTVSANTTFGGRSLTLDGGARVILKGKNSKTTISDFRLYNSRLHHGEGSSALTIAGGMTIYATAANPALIQGAGGRSLTLESNISGASGTRIKVESSSDAHSGSNPFFLNLKGNNSGYAGSFEVVGERFALVGYNGNAFGSPQTITLTDGGRLFSGSESTIALSSAAITLDNGGVFGVYTKTGSNVGLQISSGTISGTGTLTIDNTGTEGAHDRRVALGNVTISGIDGIVATNTLQLASGYDNTSTPITIAQPRMLRLTNGVKAGPVTLQAGANAESSDENVSLASLTLETTAAGTPFIRKYLHKGLVTITGDITNDLASGEKIRIDFTVTAITQLASTNAYRVLSAANLGVTGVTAADFVATYDNDNAVEALRPYITGGTFSIETVGDVKYLVYTLRNKVVLSTGADASGSSSFNAGTKWNDGTAPHNDADYFILSGHEIRSVNGASAEFKGQSLNVLEGGKFSVIGSNKSGVTATIEDFHLCGGAILIAKSNWGNNLAGAITISGSSSNPAIYETEWASGSPEPSGRWLTVHSNISGNGSLLCRYLNQAATALGAPVAGLNLRGDNRYFTGEWQIMHPAAKATFESASNVGSASAIVLNSNGVFQAQGNIELPAATAVVVKNVGSVAGSEDLSNGGTILVDENKTLTVNGAVSGAGILRKSGAGTLRLAGASASVGGLKLGGGTLAVAGPLTVTDALAVTSASSLRVETADGITIQGASPFSIDAGAAPLDVWPTAFDNLGSEEVYRTPVFVLPNAATFDTTQLSIGKPRGYTAEFEVASDGATGCIVYAKASHPAFVLVVR